MSEVMDQKVGPLNMSSHLSEWVAFKAIVGEDAAEIWVAGEKDAIHIPGLTLEPVGPEEEGGHRGNGGHLIAVCFHPDPGVVSVAEEVVNDLKTEGLRGIVHPADIQHLLELGLRVVPQEPIKGTERRRLSLFPTEKRSGGFSHVMRGTMWSGEVMSVSCPW